MVIVGVNQRRKHWNISSLFWFFIVVESRGMCLSLKRQPCIFTNAPAPCSTSALIELIRKTVGSTKSRLYDNSAGYPQLPLHVWQGRDCIWQMSSHINTLLLRDFTCNTMLRLIFLSNTLKLFPIPIEHNTSLKQVLSLNQEPQHNLRRKGFISTKWALK